MRTERPSNHLPRPRGIAFVIFWGLDMSKPWLKHRDITVREYLSTMSKPYWYAQMEGFATPGGEKVVAGRRADSAGGAIVLLREALEEQGYEVRAER